MEVVPGVAPTNASRVTVSSTRFHINYTTTELGTRIICRSETRAKKIIGDLIVVCPCALILFLRLTKFRYFVPFSHSNADAPTTLLVCIRHSTTIETIPPEDLNIEFDRKFTTTIPPTRTYS